jgi:hypothetical protein
MDPWLKADNRDLINLFYMRTIEWLAGGGGPHYWVDKLFLWSVGSWDVMGLNQDSYSEEGMFFLPDVAYKIADHNYKANARIDAAAAAVAVAGPAAAKPTSGTTAAAGVPVTR